MNLIGTWLAGSELAGNSEQCHILTFPVMHSILLHVCTQLLVRRQELSTLTIIVALNFPRKYQFAMFWHI